MAGYRSSRFRHDCTRWGCLIDKMPSWDFMEGCFPRDIMPSDVDGLVEVDGRFLLIEQKGYGVSLTAAQSRAHKRLVAAAPPGIITVLYLRETRDENYFDCLVFPVTEGTQGFERRSIPEVQQWLRAWSAGTPPDTVRAATHEGALT